MPKHLFLLSVLLMVLKTQAQNVGIGTTTPHASAMLDISSNNKGLLMPRMSSAQRNAIVAPAKGLMAFDSSQNSFWYYTGTAWKELSGGNYSSDSTLVVGQQAGIIQNHNLTYSNSTADSSGYLYDSGGPSGNYGNNEEFGYTIHPTGDQIATDIIVLSNNLESPYDSLIISDEFGQRHVLVGTITGSYRFFGTVYILIKTNFANTATGFAIRWNGVFPGINNNYDASQTTGWYYNPAKNYMRGGVNANNSWSPDSSGLYSFAFGHNNKAKGSLSTAMGDATTASGYSSTAMGFNTNASGNFSTAIGRSTTASGYSSTAMGFNSNASGIYSTAMGKDTYASVDNSTAMGYKTTASGLYSTALGALTQAIGNSSTAMGGGTTASNDYSTAMGYNTNAIANYSASMGYITTASGLASTTTGFYTKSKSFGGLSIGLYNDSTNAANATNFNALNRIFQIGNGTSDATRSNAMTVLQNGNIGIGELNPVVPLNFASSLGNKISLWGIAANHYGIGIQSNLMQFYSASNGDNIAFGYGNSNSFTENVRFNGNGNVGIGTSNPAYMLTVKNDIDLDNSDANAGTIANALKFGGGSTGEAIGSNRTTATNQWGLDFYTNYLNRMSISQAGNVGIGTTAPSAKLSVNGSANNATGNWGVFSDVRVKNITGNFTDGLNVISQINPIVFNYNENAPFKTSDEQIGIVAQDLEKIAPYMVSKQAYNQFTDLREVNNQAYVFLLINAVKEQQQQIAKQQVQIESQQNENTLLRLQVVSQQKESKVQRERMDALEKFVNELSRKIN